MSVPSRSPMTALCKVSNKISRLIFCAYDCPLMAMSTAAKLNKSLHVITCHRNNMAQTVSHGPSRSGTL
jgi:molybdopterin-guanine dinucleotide biosynthesis protein A